jgi:hypothetical protein
VSTKVKEDKRKIAPKGFLSFNRFTILKIEEESKNSSTNDSFKNVNFNTIETGKKKKRKHRRTNKKRRISEKRKDTERSESSESIFPQVLRCNSCMKTHFPVIRFCKWSLSKSEAKIGKEKKKTEPVQLDEETKYLLHNHIRYLELHASKEIPRLKGGAGNNEGNPSILVTRAIESARKHEINLEQGTLNDADGNCAFDAVINNINDRKCFHEKLTLPSNVYRQVWVTELEMESSNYATLGAGYSEEEKKENWNRLKQSGVYEIDFFGDLVIHAIAKGCRKTIFIFNTSTDAGDPIYVVKPSQFGGFEDHEIPVVVGYNQVHYESLHPVT